MFEPTADLAYWAAVARKILQRGHNPHVSPRAASLIADVSADAPSCPTDDEVLAALGVATRMRSLDACFELHPTFEQPFWSRLEAEHPALCHWVTPQAPLEALARRNAATASSRWVDFLVWVPGSEPVVLELDGAGHQRQRDVDRQRDELLAASRLRVERHDGPAALDASGKLSELVRSLDSAVPLKPAASDIVALRQRMLGPAALNRFTFALVEAVMRGLLPAGQSWHVELHDSLGVAEPAAGLGLDLLAAVAELWGLAVVPDTVGINGTLWHRSATGRFEAAESTEGHEPSVRIELDSELPPHAALPSNNRPTIVVRHAFVPAALAWESSSSNERRNIPPDRDVTRALTMLLQEIFGLPDFRSGQVEPIRRLLSGADGLVMLPTGGGKSLLYQLGALLRPGLAIIVDPLVSLIDDQERRLRECGISRVAGIHAGRPREVQDTVASGDALFVFVTPERFQVRSFREQLAASAAQQLVNLTVVDEAHCVSEWGHDFRTAYLFLARNLRSHCQTASGSPPPLLALTGTASPAVLRDIVRELEIDAADEGAVMRPDSFDRPNLRYLVVQVDPALRTERLARFLLDTLPRSLSPNEDIASFHAARGKDTASGLVFVPHVNGKSGLLETQKLIESELAAAGCTPVVEVYSGSPPKGLAEKTWAERKVTAASRFLRNEAPILVSTKAFGMGVDKPNIRYTVHVGMPSSIEAFAQEAGRAGRDDMPSECILIAGVAPADTAQRLLDLSTPPDRRRDLYQTDRGGHDLGHQLFFLYNSFPSAEAELKASIALFDELWLGGGPGSELKVPRSTKEHGQALRDKAVYRLAALGMIDDFTVEGTTLEVRQTSFSAGSIDQALLEFTQRIEPGRRTAYERVIASAPADLPGRVHHHLRLVVETLYRTIEPARLRALDEMYRLAVSGDDPEGVRHRINAYLGDGPLAAVLPSLIEGATKLDLASSLQTLATVPLNAFDWAGATARQLENTPGHPLALMAASLAQALMVRGSLHRFADQLAAAIEALPDYDAAPGDAELMFGWVHERLAALAPERVGPARVAAWEALPAALLESPRLEAIERQRLTDVDATPIEMEAILTRRLRRVGSHYNRYIEEQIG